MERLTYVKHPHSWSRGKYPTKYTSRYTFQEVVARLAAYEDTGLMPEEIPERLVMLPPVCYKEDGGECAYQTYDGTDEPIDECKECPLCCVDKQRHRQPPNPPLNVADLRKLDGEPVWIERFMWIERFNGYLVNKKEWALVFVKGGVCRASGANVVFFHSYGRDWLAYRYKKEEET